MKMAHNILSKQLPELKLRLFSSSAFYNADDNDGDKDGDANCTRKPQEK